LSVSNGCCVKSKGVLVTVIASNHTSKVQSLM